MGEPGHLLLDRRDYRRRCVPDVRHRDPRAQIDELVAVGIHHDPATGLGDEHRQRDPDPSRPRPAVTLQQPPRPRPRNPRDPLAFLPHCHRPAPSDSASPESRWASQTGITEKTISAAASTVTIGAWFGRNRLLKIQIARVCTLAPAVNVVGMLSSKESANASNGPARNADRING